MRELPGPLSYPPPELARLPLVVLFFEILLVAVSILIGWFGLYVFYRLFTES